MTSVRTDATVVVGHGGDSSSRSKVRSSGGTKWKPRSAEASSGGAQVGITRAGSIWRGG